MCFYIIDNERMCPKAPSKNRCSYHKGKNITCNPQIIDSELAVEMFQKNRKCKSDSDRKKKCICPCGNTFTRWNLSSHCKSKTHRDWVEMLPEPKSVEMLNTDNDWMFHRHKYIQMK